MEEMFESAPEAEESNRVVVLQANEGRAMSQYSGLETGLVMCLAGRGTA
jgi:hypothetical protein